MRFFRWWSSLTVSTKCSVILAVCAIVEAIPKILKLLSMSVSFVLRLLSKEKPPGSFILAFQIYVLLSSKVACSLSIDKNSDIIIPFFLIFVVLLSIEILYFFN